MARPPRNAAPTRPSTSRRPRTKSEHAKKERSSSGPGTADKHGKQAIIDRAAQDLAAGNTMPAWTLRQRLALACRILAAEGHGSGLAGQMTARGDTPDTMWTLPYGMGFEEVRARDYILVDQDLRPVRGKGRPNPANRFHLHVYRQRPDVQAIVHTHPPHVSALSMLGEPLVAAHMDTAMFFEDCAFLPDWPGVPFGDEEGGIICRALGDKRAILLAHHGQLCAARSVEEAVVMGVAFERAARLQLLARAVGPIRPIRPDLGREAHDWRLNPEPVAVTFHYYARQVLASDTGCLS
jgi:L-fuculose-phosphate aldolase